MDRSSFTSADIPIVNWTRGLIEFADGNAKKNFATLTFISITTPKVHAPFDALKLVRRL